MTQRKSDVFVVASICFVAGCGEVQTQENSSRYLPRSNVKRIATQKEVEEIFSRPVSVSTGREVHDGYSALLTPDRVYRRDGFGAFVGRYEVRGGSVCVTSTNIRINYCDEVLIGPDGPAIRGLVMNTH